MQCRFKFFQILISGGSVRSQWLLKYLHRNTSIQGKKLKIFFLKTEWQEKLKLAWKHFQIEFVQIIMQSNYYIGIYKENILNHLPRNQFARKLLHFYSTFFAGSFDSKVMAYKDIFLYQSISLAASISGVTPLRITKPSFYMDSGNGYFVATLLDRAPILRKCMESLRKKMCR